MHLQTWLADGGHGKSPENTDRLLTLYDISKALEFLHIRSLVHGGLQPSSFLWFSAQVPALDHASVQLMPQLFCA